MRYAICTSSSSCLPASSPRQDIEQMLTSSGITTEHVARPTRSITITNKTRQALTSLFRFALRNLFVKRYAHAEFLMTPCCIEFRPIARAWLAAPDQERVTSEGCRLYNEIIPVTLAI